MKSSQISILHITTDEKFINAALYLFEKAAPHSNSVRIIVPNKHYKLKHIEESARLNFWCLDNVKMSEIENDIRGYNIIVFHSIDYFRSRIINNVLKNRVDVKLCWMFWGGEVYNNRYLNGSSRIGEITKKRFQSSSLLAKIKDAFLPAYLFLSRINHPHFSILKAIKNVNYIGSFDEDFDFLKRQKLLRNDAIQLRFTYYPIEFIFKGLEDLKIKGGNILLGNSATLTNNHLEAFEKLKLLNIGNKKIIVPLSYGDEFYAKEISKIGSDLFSNNFFSLVEFMPLEKYNRYISQCGVSIMNHYRQQAVGNILSLIWMGSKVFLSERSTVYHYLKRIGVTIYSVERHLVSSENPLELLSLEAVELNRGILKKEIGEDILTESLVNTLNLSTDIHFVSE